MAGAGFKTFNTGDVLTASDVNTYLMQQTVMVFADSSARSTALGANVAEGMLSYLKDTNAVEVYDGSNWVSSDDPNAIQNTIVDAKGDIITATAADTPARLAVGSNGYTLVADSSTSTGLAYSPTFFAGKNKIINGDFGINQRAFTSTTTSSTYGFDRWKFVKGGTVVPTVTYSAQTFTAGTAPVSGYEGINFARMATTTGSSSDEYSIFQQPIEDVRTFAGQTVTFSFWAKASSGTPKVGVELWQTFGSGGSSSTGAAGQSVTISTSWARYSVTIANPSVSGKTIGAGSYTEANLWCSGGSTFNTRSGSVGNQTATIDFWGVQVEAGSTATQFQTATGTIQGELAACQRYYEKTYAQGTAPATSTQSNMVGNPSGGINSTATGYFGYYIPFKVTKRSSPTITLYDAAGTSGKVSKYESVNLTKTDGITGSADSIGESSIRVTITSVSGYCGFAFHYVADSEL